MNRCDTKTIIPALGQKLDPYVKGLRAYTFNHSSGKAKAGRTLSSRSARAT